MPTPTISEAIDRTKRIPPVGMNNSAIRSSKPRVIRIQGQKPYSIGFLDPRSNFLHHNAIAFDLNDLDALAGIDVTALCDHIQELVAELGLPGRTEGGRRLSDGAQESRGILGGC